MKAIQVHSFGGPEVLEAEEVARPKINADDVLVEVYASGVNPVDTKVREGAMKHMLPFIPGWDMSGVIVETGSQVTDFKKGDAVYGRPDIARNGSYAEYIAVRATELGHKPVSVNYVAAAAIPLSGLTAWQALFEHGKIKEGQKVFIHGASGGVGTFAVQFAHWAGAYVIGTGSAGNLEFLKDIGANEAVDYHIEGFEDQYNDLDMVLDTIGGDTQTRSLQMLKPGGILVTTLQIEDHESFSRKGVRITGMFTQSRTEDLEKIATLADEGKINPVIFKVLPLEQAEEAHRLSEEGHIRGKIVLKVRNE